MADGVTLRISGLSRADLPRIRRVLPEGAECVELSRRVEPPMGKKHKGGEIYGRLIEIDLLARTAWLQSPENPDDFAVLRFRAEHAEALLAAAGKLISADGLAHLDAHGTVQLLDLSRLKVQPEDQPPDPIIKPFRWRTIDERLPNVDFDEYLRTSRDFDPDQESE